MSHETNLASFVLPKYNGWFYSKLSGTYQEIGYQHGKTHADMINKIIGRMKEYVYWSSGFNNYCNDENRLKQLVPELARARLAMETAGSFDEYIKIMKHGNTGGYANSWLVGDTNKNEIMRFELGYAFAKETITSNGYFVGFNAPIDPEIRNLECTNIGYMDIRRHQGARQVRLTQLVEKYRGEITPDIAKVILSDHNDPYRTQLEGKEIDNLCSRNVDAHYELDPRQYMSQIGRPLPYQPQGAVDGKIADSIMARDLNFCVRFGS